MNRHETILRKEDAALLVVDFQERFIEVMDHSDTVCKEIVRLTVGMNLLEIPVLVTEQYPKGLGHTVSEILDELDDATREKTIEKMTFSCCGSESFLTALKEFGCRQVIVTGIETHVCVLQTVLDLIANGYQVHLPMTATCSRADQNRDNALDRMRDAGAVITNVESVLFELLIEAGTDDFKKVRKLIV